MPPRKKSKISNPSDNTQVIPEPTAGSSKGGQRDLGLPRQTLRGRKGFLKDLPDMPVDILAEIFSYLRPQDLLTLARTNKAFRSFLLHKNNAHIWRSVREAEQDVLPLPPFMSEPALAHLIFSTYCNSCGNAPTRNVTWVWYAKYCNTCFRERQQRLQYWTLGQLKLLDKETLEQCSGSCYDLLNILHSSDSSGAVYHVPQLEQFVRDWNAAESASARMEVYKRQKAVVASREEYAHLLEKWWQNRKRNRAQELEALKTQRLSDISDRLTRLGWGDEIRRLCDTDEGRAKLRRINSVFQPAKLTDKTFENVRRNMTELLTETRNTLAKEKRQATLSNNLKLLTTALEAHYVQIPRTPRMLCRPYVADILFEPEIKAALTSSTADLLTAQDLASVTLTVCQRWEELVKQELRAMVRAEVGDIDDDIDPLQLAVAFFSCSRCHNAALRYPEVLAHRCRLDYERLWPEPVDQYVLDVHSVTFIGLRNGSFIRPLGLGAARLAPGAKELLTALGMPPTTTTMKQLMQDNVRFRRLDDGKYPGDDRKVHTWIGVSRCFKARWRLATAEELDAISQLALESHTPGIHDLHQGIPWVCALCSREWSGYCDDKFEVEQHLQSMHNLEDVRVEQCVKDGTIFLHPGHAYSYRPIPLPDAPDSV